MVGGWARPGWRLVGAPAALGSWEPEFRGRRGSDGQRSSAPAAEAQGSPKEEGCGGSGWGRHPAVPLSPDSSPGMGGAWSPEAAAGQASAWGLACWACSSRPLPGQGSLSWAKSLWSRGFYPCSITDEVWLWVISAATAKRPDMLTVVPPAVHQDPSFREGLGESGSPQARPRPPSALLPQAKQERPH